MNDERGGLDGGLKSLLKIRAVYICRLQETNIGDVFDRCDG